MVNGCSLPYLAISVDETDGSLRSVHLDPGTYTLIMGFNFESGLKEYVKINF